MINEILSLSKILISVPTVIGDQNYLDLALEIVYQDLNDYNFKKFTSNNFSSFLYFNTDSYKTPFKVILNGQLDVAFAKDSQFKPYIKNGKLYGRGAFDMKSATAAMILVYKELAKEVDYPLALQLTTDQELDGRYCTLYQIEQGVTGEFVLNTSTTDLAISNESKGNLKLKITAHGKRAASAYLWEGKNAIWQMKKFLDTLEKEFPEPTSNEWKTTVNIGDITTTNKTITTVPEDCEVLLDIKFIRQDRETILKKIKDMISKDFTVDVLINEPPHYTPEDNPYISVLGDTISKHTGKPYQFNKRPWSGTLRHYNTIGANGVSLGPIGGGMHSDEEWVDIKSLELYYKILKEFLLSVK